MEGTEVAGEVGSTSIKRKPSRWRGGEKDIQECSRYLVKMCPKRDFKNAGDAMIKRLRKDSKA